jgi:LMBR1-like membrane protein
MASGTGSGIFVIQALVLVSLLVLLLLRHFVPLRSSPAYLIVPIFLALALPASIILLVPVDLASSAGRGLT